MHECGPRCNCPGARAERHEAGLDKMVTQGRAETVARLLFRAERAVGDCPCDVCVDQRNAWQDRIAQVRRAVKEAFR